MRRGHYPITTDVDIRPLYDRFGGRIDREESREIELFLDETVHRPLSHDLVANAHPVIVSSRLVAQWRTRNPELTQDALPATVPLSDDAVIAFEHGWGTGGIWLRNYDFKGRSDEQKLASVAEVLDNCFAKVAPREQEDGVDRLSGFEHESATHDFGRFCGAPVLSDVVWSRLAEKYPDGAYVAFPFETPQFGSLETLLVDKRIPGAQAILRGAFAKAEKDALDAYLRLTTKPTCAELNRQRLAQKLEASHHYDAINAELRKKGLPPLDKNELLEPFSLLSNEECEALWELRAAFRPTAFSFQPVSRHIYERRDGRLVVVE